MRLSLLLCSALACTLVSAAPVLTEDFENPDPRWQQDIRGDASIEIAPGGVEGNCLKITSTGGHAYYTMKLDPEKLRGLLLEVRGMVKAVDVQQGPQTYSTAKYHVGQRTKSSEQVINKALWFTGTFDWTEKIMNVQIEDDATDIVLDFGTQNGTGTVYYDNIVVKDMLGTGRPVSLNTIANRGRSDGIAGDGEGSFLDTGMHDLFGLPAGNLETDEVTFYVPRHGDNSGQTCVILKGKQRPDYPAGTDPAPVGTKARALWFLHASAWADTASKEPCLMYDITYADGEETCIEMRAGVDIGNFDSPADLENWKVVWQDKDGLGKQVGVGATKWMNPRPSVPIKSLAIRSAGNGVPIVLAVSYLK